MKPLQEFASNQQAGSGGRDPRTDPKAGDVLMLPHGNTLDGRALGLARSTVLAVDDYAIYGRSVNSQWSGPWSCAKSQWRAWAKNAEVIHRAEEAKP